MPLQLHQNLNLLLLLALGYWSANIRLSWGDIFTLLTVTLFVEHLFLFFNKKRPFYLSYSALSTAIGVVLLLYANELWIYLFVITLGLFQKHFLNFNGKHLFNPSNFALIIALVLFYDEATIITGQLGDDILLSMLALVLALSMLVRVGRLFIPLAFTLTYLFFQHLLILFSEPTLHFEEVYHRFYIVTFMLFIYFMLTDPAVTPRSLKGQILFGCFVALLATLLDFFYGFRVQHLFMSLFFLSFWTNILPLNRYSTQELKLAVTILFLTIGGLSYIEYQTPYYLEMNG